MIQEVYTITQERLFELFDHGQRGFTYKRVDPFNTALVAESKEQFHCLVKEFWRVWVRKNFIANVEQRKVIVIGRKGVTNQGGR